jgi:GNAT superfamily N-acetyltransferase
MTGEAVRTAQPADIDELVRLELLAREALIDQRGGHERLRELPALGGVGFRRSFDQHDVACIVATWDEVIVGYGVIAIEHGIAMVQAIFVEPEARELGLGELLLDELIGWARQMDADFLEAIALPGDRETKNMYERFGIKARALIVSTALKHPSTAEPASQ